MTINSEIYISAKFFGFGLIRLNRSNIFIFK